MACVRTPRERRRVSKVWDVEATTGAVSDLADQLTELGVEKVTVESTSDYWRNLVLPARGGRTRGAAGQRP